MTYDDWKARDDSPEPDPNRCADCGHPESHCDCQCCVGPDPDRENDARKAGDFDEIDEAEAIFSYYEKPGRVEFGD